jgi:hypothetical protein
MTYLVFVIVLFFASAGGAGHQTASLSVSFDGYEACATALAGIRTALPAEQRQTFAGAACVEMELGGLLTEAMPG